MKNEVDILLVEDSVHDAELIMRTLSKVQKNSTIHLITDGEEALDFFFATGKYSLRDIQLTPKVIILDLKLPKVNGMEILERLKSDERTKKIPVVVLSSSNEEKDLARSYSLGVNSYIVKPVNFQNFNKMVNELGVYWLHVNERAQ